MEIIGFYLFSNVLEYSLCMLKSSNSSTFLPLSGADLLLWNASRILEPIFSLLPLQVLLCFNVTFSYTNRCVVYKGKITCLTCLVKLINISVPYTFCIFVLFLFFPSSFLKSILCVNFWVEKEFTMLDFHLISRCVLYVS